MPPPTVPPVSGPPVSGPPAVAAPEPATTDTSATSSTPPNSSTPPVISGTSAPTAGRVAPVTTVTSGTLIMGTYEIETLINSGGMGEVYRGRNIHNGELVAIKIVLPSLAHDPKIVALFQKESTTLSRLSHEAIVRYHVFTNDPTIGRPCMVMEFVSGTALSDRIEQGPMPLEDVQVMLRRVASGLDKAHRAGVVHRDLSPDNVILEENSVEHAKLIDFGIAKSTNIGAGTLLQGQFAGKFNWVSPEQLGAHGGIVDGRSDIYSLALLIAAASKGEVLKMGSSIVDAVGKRSSVPDLSGVDPQLVALLRWMLQPDPALRIESMAKVIAALDNPGLIPVAEVAMPVLPDPNRTVIGGILPLTGAAGAMSLPPVPVASLPPVGGAVPSAPAGAGVITGRSPLPDEEPEDFSPFGAPTAAAAVTEAFAVPVARKGKGGLVAVLLLLAVGGGAGAYFGGVFDPKPAIQLDANATAEEKAAAAAAEAEAAAEAIAAEAKAAAEAAAEQAAAEEAAAKVAADEAAAKQLEAEAKAAADVEAQKAAEAEAATKLAAEQAAKAAEEAAAAKAAEDAAAAKAAQDAEAAKAAEAAAAAAAAAKLAADEAAATQAAEEAAAKARAEAEAAALAADPLARQQAFMAAYVPPACALVRTREAKPEGFVLDGYAVETKPLEQMADAFLASTELSPDVALHLINDAQCPVLDFINRHGTKSKPVSIRFADAGEVIKSGGAVSGVVEGLDGRPFTLFLVSEAGGATNLKPWVAVASDGTASFSFTVSLAAGAPPAPQLLLAIATDTALAELDAVPNGVTAKSLMPFVELKLTGAAMTPGTGISFFRLEN